MVAPLPNVCFQLLDLPVVEGAADEALLHEGTRTWSHARALEEVAALGGVLRHLGVRVGTPVRLALGAAHDVEAVLTALATARLGGVVTTTGEADVVVASAGSDVTAREVRLLRADAGASAEEPDLDWAVMLRAGRADPAPCEVLDGEAAYSADRTVAQQLAAVRDAAAPHDVTDLRRLLQA